MYSVNFIPVYSKTGSGCTVYTICLYTVEQSISVHCTVYTIPVYSKTVSGCILYSISRDKALTISPPSQLSDQDILSRKSFTRNKLLFNWSSFIYLFFFGGGVRREIWLFRNSFAFWWKRSLEKTHKSISGQTTKS